MHHHYFDEELLALRAELEYHPDLQTILAAQPNEDIYIHIAEIAAYCNVVLYGDYTREDMLKVCEELTKALQKKRIIIVQ